MKVAQVDPLAGMFNFDADHISVLVVIEHDIVSDFLRIGARALAELNVKRISIWKVFESHGIYLGLNRRSGKALCSVPPSLNVTTRKCLPSSSMYRQWRMRPSGCTSVFSGLSTVCSH